MCETYQSIESPQSSPSSKVPPRVRETRCGRPLASCLRSGASLALKRRKKKNVSQISIQIHTHNFVRRYHIFLRLPPKNKNNIPLGLTTNTSAPHTLLVSSTNTSSTLALSPSLSTYGTTTSPLTPSTPPARTLFTYPIPPALKSAAWIPACWAMIYTSESHGEMTDFACTRNSLVGIGLEEDEEMVSCVLSFWLWGRGVS